VFSGLLTKHLVSFLLQTSTTLQRQYKSEQAGYSKLLAIAIKVIEK
jgi:hypothetical protein